MEFSCRTFKLIFTQCEIPLVFLIDNSGIFLEETRKKDIPLTTVTTHVATFFNSFFFLSLFVQSTFVGLATDKPYIGWALNSIII